MYNLINSCKTSNALNTSNDVNNNHNPVKSRKLTRVKKSVDNQYKVKKINRLNKKIHKSVTPTKACSSIKCNTFKCKSNDLIKAMVLIDKYDVIVKFSSKYINIKGNFGDNLLNTLCYNEYASKLNIVLKNPNIDVNAGNNMGFTALHFAANRFHNRKDTNFHLKINIKQHLKGNIIKPLLEYPNINVNVQSINGDTPLHYACYLNDLYVIYSLIHHKNIDPNITNNNGYTALHIACSHNHHEAVKLLLECSVADTSIKNKNGETPYDVAVKQLNGKDYNETTDVLFLEDYYRDNVN